MPMPCYADRAARDYAYNESLWESHLDAVAELADDIDTWPLDQVRTKLKPHEAEALDEIISAVAERLLTTRAQESFNEPDLWD